MELINKKFNIWAKSITELTVKDLIDNYGKFCDKNIKPFESVFTYDGKTGRIILYKENKDFEFYKKLIISYLAANDTERRTIKEQSLADGITNNVFKTLDTAINEQERGIWKTIKMLEVQDTNIVGNLYTLYDIHNKSERGIKSLINMVQYGIILGKRMERQKRKKSYAPAVKPPQQTEN